MEIRLSEFLASGDIQSSLIARHCVAGVNDCARGRLPLGTRRRRRYVTQDKLQRNFNYDARETRRADAKTPWVAKTKRYDAPGAEKLHFLHRRDKIGITQIN